MAFIETPRFPDNISYGSVSMIGYKTRVVQTVSGYETRNADWTYPLLKFNVSHALKDSADTQTLIAYFHSVMGKLYGFRYKDFTDWKSTYDTSAPAATDQILGAGDGSTLAYQIRKAYTTGSQTTYRKIIKPVSGTVLVAIGGVTVDQLLTIDTTTGVITFDADLTASITSIVIGTGVITTGAAHGLSVGDAVYFSGITGTTELNTTRHIVATVPSSTTFTLETDISGYTAYVSGGTTNTIPQTGENVTAGFEFDVPVRFDSDILNVAHEVYEGNTFQVMLREIRE